MEEKNNGKLEITEEQFEQLLSAEEYDNEHPEETYGRYFYSLIRLAENLILPLYISILDDDEYDEYREEIYEKHLEFEEIYKQMKKGRAGK